MRRAISKSILTKIQIVVALLFISMQSFGQMEPISSLSQHNLMYYNPAYAGNGEAVEAKALHREQWMGFEGSPQTSFLNAHMPFNMFSNKHGVGVSIMRDAYGFWENISANISYAYRKQLMQGEIGFGAGLNIVNYNLQPTWNTGNGDVGSGTGSDYYIPEKTESNPTQFDMNLGVFFSNDNVYFSASTRNLMGSDIKWKGQSNVSPTAISQVLFISSGYTYQLTNPMYAVQPNFQLLSDFTETAINFNTILTYNNKFHGGLGYRPRDAIAIIAGMSLKNGIEVSMAYDIGTSKLSKNSDGSFEFMLGYSFNMSIDKDKRKYKSVRFL